MIIDVNIEEAGEGYTATLCTIFGIILCLKLFQNKKFITHKDNSEMLI